MRYGEELRLRLSLMDSQANTFMGLAGSFSQMFPTMQNPMYSATDNLRAHMSTLHQTLLEHEFNFGSQIHESHLDDYCLIRKVKELTKDDSIELSELVWMEEIPVAEQLTVKHVEDISRKAMWRLDGPFTFTRPAVEFVYHPTNGFSQTSVMSIPSMNVEVRHLASRGVALRISLEDFVGELNKRTGLALTYEEWVAIDDPSVRDDWMRCARKSLSNIRTALFEQYREDEYSSDPQKRELFRNCEYLNGSMSRTISNWSTSKHHDAYHRAQAEYRQYYFKLKEIGLEDLWEDVEITEPPTQETDDAS